MKLLSVLDIDTSSFHAGLTGADTALRVFERSVGTSSAVIKDFATLLSGVGLSRLIGEAVMAGDEMLNLQRKLNVLANSLQELDVQQGRVADKTATGTKMYGELRDMALATGTSMRTLSQAYMQMIPIGASLGVSIKTIKDMILGTIGAAAAMGVSHVELDRIFVAMRQTLGKNQLQMEELRGQMGEALPNAMIILSRGLNKIANDSPDVARQLGVISGAAKITTVEMNKMITGAKIDGKIFSEAMAAGLEMYKKFAEAKQISVSGQAINVKTIFETQSGMFMANSGINTALGAALKTANDSVDIWLSKQVAKAEENGAKFIEAFMDKGQGIAKHLDKTQDFHSQIGATIGATISTIMSGADAVWANLPPEAREIGLVGMMFWGKTTLSFLGGMQARTAALIGFFSVGLLEKILPEDWAFRMYEWGVSLVRAVADGMAAGSSSLGAATEAIIRNIMKMNKVDGVPGATGSSGIGAGYDGEGIAPEKKKKEQSLAAKMHQNQIDFDAISQADKLSYPKENGDKYAAKYGESLGREFGEEVGKLKYSADLIIRFISSIGGALGQGTAIFEPDALPTAIHANEAAFLEWKKKWQLQFDTATQAIKNLNMEGGMIESQSSDTILKNTLADQIAMAKQANASIGRGLAANDPGAKILADFNQRELSTQGLDAKMQLGSGKTLEQGWDALPGMGGIQGGARNAEISANFGATIAEAMKPAVRETLQETISANENQMAALGKLLDKINNGKTTAQHPTGNRSEFGVEEFKFVDKEMYPESAKAGLRAQVTAGIVHLGAAVGSTLERVAASDTEKALYDLKRTVRRTTDLEQSGKQAAGAYGEMMLAEQLGPDSPQAKSLKAKAALEKREMELKDDRGNPVRDSGSSVFTNTTAEELKKANENDIREMFVAHTETIRKFNNAFLPEKLFSVQQNTRQTNAETVALRENTDHYGDEKILEKQAMLELSIENNKLEILAMGDDNYRSALIDQEMGKLRLEEKTLTLQQDVYHQSGHSEQTLKNEMEKLNLEMDKLGLEKSLYSSPEYRQKLDDAAHARSERGLVKAQDTTRQMGGDQFKSDGRAAEYESITQSIQKSKNDVEMMRKTEWQVLDTEKSRHAVGVQIAQTQQSIRNYMSAEWVAAQGQLSTSNQQLSNAQAEAEIKRMTQKGPAGDGARAAHDKGAYLGLLREQISLERQIVQIKNPQHAAQMNINEAMRGTLATQQLLNTYSRSFGQYLKAGMAQAIATFSSAMTNGLFKVVTGQQKVKAMFKEITQLVVGGLIKAVIEYGVQQSIVHAADVAAWAWKHMQSLLGIAEIEAEEVAEGISAAAKITEIGAIAAAGTAALVEVTISGAIAALILEAFWAPAAMAASIATFGAAALAGAAAYEAAMALTFFHTGGIFGTDEENSRRGSGLAPQGSGLKSDEGLAILQHGEMIVQKGEVARTVEAMKMNNIPLPEGVYHSGGIFGGQTNYNFRSSDTTTGASHLSNSTVSAMGKSPVQVVNYFDFADVEKHLVRNPNAILNVMVNDKRNNGVTSKLYDKKARGR